MAGDVIAGEFVTPEREARAGNHQRESHVGRWHATSSRRF
jgi:hypothetical protein